MHFCYINSESYFSIKEGKLCSHSISEIGNIFERFPNIKYIFFQGDKDLLKANKVANLNAQVFLQSEWDKLFLTKYLSNEEIMRFFTLYFCVHDEFSLEVYSEYDIDKFPVSLQSWLSYTLIKPTKYAYPTNVMLFLNWLLSNKVKLPASNQVEIKPIKLNEIPLTNELDLSQFVEVPKAFLKHLTSIESLSLHQLSKRSAKPNTYAFSLAEWNIMQPKLGDLNQYEKYQCYLHIFQETCSLGKLLPYQLTDLKSIFGLIGYWQFALCLNFLQKKQALPHLKLQHRFLFELLSLWYIKTEQSITEFTLSHYYTDNDHVGFLSAEGELSSSNNKVTQFKKGGGFGSKRN